MSDHAYSSLPAGGGGSGVSSVAARILLGQLLSLCMATTGLFSTLLVNNGVSLPLLQSLCGYTLLVVVITVPAITAMRRRCQRAPVGTPSRQATIYRPWRYAVIASFDVAASYCVVLAYNSTDMTSVQLLDCSTILYVMVLSRLVFGATYTRLKLFGVAVALSGLVVLILADRSNDTRSNPSPHPLRGDALALLGSFFYACTNVACEALLKATGPSDTNQDPNAGAQAQVCDDHVDPVNEASPGGRIIDDSRQPSPPSTVPGGSFTSNGSSHTNNSSLARNAVMTDGHYATRQKVVTRDVQATVWEVSLEYLIFIGTFGALYTGVLFAVVEYKSSREVDWSMPVHNGVYMGVFAVFFVVAYLAIPFMLERTSSTFLNLSLLSADMFSMLYNYIILGQQPKPLLLVAFCVTTGGLVLYNYEPRRPSLPDDDPEEV